MIPKVGYFEKVPYEQFKADYKVPADFPEEGSAKSTTTSNFPSAPQAEVFAMISSLLFTSVFTRMKAW